jgi:hypothetical protein
MVGILEKRWKVKDTSKVSTKQLKSISDDIKKWVDSEIGYYDECDTVLKLL